MSAHGKQKSGAAGGAVCANIVGLLVVSCLAFVMIALPVDEEPTVEETPSQQVENPVFEGSGASIKTSSYLDTLPSGVVLLSEYTTTSESDNANRAANISYACEQLDHRIVEPGETLSLESILGDTTDAAHYASAPTIADGSTTANEIGGGVCQLASTLYYAGLSANMTSVERYAHSIPPDYIPLGFDATLEYGSMDLKMRNDSETPIYIEALTDGTSVTVRCYGNPLSDDARIELISETQEIIAPGEPEIMLTSVLSAGDEYTQREAREGYEVLTERAYYQKNVKTDTEEISYSRYEPVNAIIIRGAAQNPK